MAPTIFVNFRRADTDKVGPHLDTALQAEFGPAEVFRDQRCIAKGSYFPDEILRNLRKCDILLAVMGKEWARVTDDSGRRCIDRPEDWVRREIALALTWGLTVLPVLIDDAALPDKSLLPAGLMGDELPDGIRGLCDRQSVTFRPHFEQVDRPLLMDAVRNAVPGLRRAPRRDGAVPGAISGNEFRFDRAAVTFGPHSTARTYNTDPTPRDDEDEARW